MLVSTYECSIVEDWRKHFGCVVVREMLDELRAELPVDRFGLVRQKYVVGDKVMVTELPKWASDARNGVVSIGKGIGRKVA